MPMRGFAGIVLFLIWLAFAAGGVAGFIVFLVAIWRWMRAHERLSEHVGEIANLLRRRQQ